MGIVSHEYKIFSFTSRWRPDVFGGVLTLSVVPKVPSHCIVASSSVRMATETKHSLIGLLRNFFAKKPSGTVKLIVKVDGRTDFPNGAYKICGLTQFDNVLHNVEIFVSRESAEADYIKLTQHLPLLTPKLPNAKIG